VREALIWPGQHQYGGNYSGTFGSMLGVYLPIRAGEGCEPSAKASRSFRNDVPWRRAEL
jgi:hypothetical protein